MNGAGKRVCGELCCSRAGVALRALWDGAGLGGRQRYSFEDCMLQYVARALAFVIISLWLTRRQ